VTVGNGTRSVDVVTGNVDLMNEWRGRHHSVDVEERKLELGIECGLRSVDVVTWVAN
jgi:hypothetical protein